MVEVDDDVCAFTSRMDDEANIISTIRIMNIIVCQACPRQRERTDEGNDSAAIVLSFGKVFYEVRNGEIKKVVLHRIIL